MTDRTKKYLSLSRHVEYMLLFEISALSADGTKKTIRAIHKGDTQEIGGERYFDILRTPGLGQIGTNTPPQGGISLQEGIDVHITARAEIDRYTLVGQALKIFLYIPHTEDKSLILSGTIRQARKTRAGVSLAVSTDAHEILPDFPSKKLSFSDYPLMPISNAGLPAPVVFGDMSTPPETPTTPDTAHLAQLSCIDVLGLKFTATPAAQSHGRTYVWDVGLNTYVEVPSAQDGDIVTLSRESSLSSALTTDSGRSSTGFERVGTNNSIWTWTIYPTPPVGINPETLSVLVNLNTVAQGVAHLIEFNGSIATKLEVGGQTYNMPTWTFQVRNVGGQGFFLLSTSGVLRVLNATVSAASIANARVVVTVTLSQPLNFPSFVPPANFAPSAEWAIGHSNPLVASRSIPNTYQAVQGYVDRAAQYRDGGPIHSEGDILTSPIDLAQAMLRDKRVGLNTPIAEIDTGNIPAIRDALGNTRIDGQIGVSRAQTFDDTSRFLEIFGVQMRRAAQYKFSHTQKSPPVALLTDENIISLSGETSRLSEIKTEFLLRYRHSRATGRHTKHLVADPNFVYHSNAASVNDNTITIPAADANILVGHKLHVEGVGVSEACTITAVNGASVEVDCSGIPQTNPVEVWIGPFFSYPCHVASSRYMVTNQPHTIETDLVADDTTAQYIMKQAIAYHTTLKHRITVRGPIGTARITDGESCAIDHRDLPRTLKPIRIGHYAAGLPYSTLDVTTGLSIENASAAAATDGIMYISHDEDGLREAIRVEGDRGRGMLHTFRRSWPSGSEVYYSPHVWTVTQRTIDAERDTVTLRLEVSG